MKLMNKDGTMRVTDRWTWVAAIVLVAVAVALFLSACGAQPVPPVNAPPPTGQPVEVWAIPLPVGPGADGNYIPNFGATQDLHIYIVTGIVQAAPGAVTSYSFEGRFSGSSGRYSGYSSGFISGGTEGKGVVRFLVSKVTIINPYHGHGLEDTEYQPIIKAGDTVMLKVVDSKASGLATGDAVVFQCRVDTDFSAAVGGNEHPTEASLASELDFCRMATPVITEPVVISSTNTITP